MWASERRPPITGQSERLLNNPMMILLKVSMCHMPKEAEPSLLNKMEDWTTAGVVCLMIASVTYTVYGIQRILRTDHESKASSR